jgi:SulP family sulfate permease
MLQMFGGGQLAQIEKVKYQPFKFTTWEFGGALGDLGTLLPLLAALVLINGVNPTSAFFVVGVAYILSGLFYRIPMPIQPLKSVASIAIATGISGSLISASGLWMAGILLFLAVTGLISKVAKLFPKPIVRGIQLGVGFLLLRAGIGFIRNQTLFVGSDITASPVLAIPLGWFIALGSGLLLFLCIRTKRIPPSLAVLGVGIIIALFIGPMGNLANVNFGIANPISVSLPSMNDMQTAFVLLVIPQIPLTLGNAVFATHDTAKQYYGDKAQRVTPKKLLTSMSGANFMAGVLGGMPVCHGSGGLTAHYRFGARTGGASIMIGAIFLAAAIFVDGNALPIFSLIPYATLGLLVAVVGFRHALLARDVEGLLHKTVVAVIAILALTTNSLAIGFAVGLTLLYGKSLVVFVKQRFAPSDRRMRVAITTSVIPPF